MSIIKKITLILPIIFIAWYSQLSAEEIKKIGKYKDWEAVVVTSVIIGATTMEQLKTNIESVSINLTEEIINEINEVQKIYPNPCP